MTYIYVSVIPTKIGSCNGLLPVQCQDITWTNDGRVHWRMRGVATSQRVYIRYQLFIWKKLKIHMTCYSVKTCDKHIQVRCTNYFRASRSFKIYISFIVDETTYTKQARIDGW